MKLKVLTLNLWGIPTLSPNVRKRIIKLTKQKDFLDADIVFLQEIWNHKDRIFLKKQLVNRYSTLTKKRICLFLDLNKEGGLMIISRYKMKNEKFYLFEDYNKSKIDERLGEKGFLTGEIEINKQKIKLITTHLGAGIGKGDVEARERQLDQLKKYILQQKIPVIVGGDFNIDDTDKEYSKIKKILNDTNTNGKFYTFDQENYIAHVRGYRIINFFNKEEHAIKKRRIDYIFTSKSFKKIDSRVVMDKGVDILSDHYGYFAKIGLKKV